MQVLAKSDGTIEYTDCSSAEVVRLSSTCLLDLARKNQLMRLL